mmetsp:Transcript_5792/g.22613  ORF Transcript_5792/g.22613 Transcript_5792/m.22613 type:complete len:213 (-) Transcript_5792:62-700(-)
MANHEPSCSLGKHGHDAAFVVEDALDDPRALGQRRGVHRLGVCVTGKVHQHPRIFRALLERRRHTLRHVFPPELVHLRGPRQDTLGDHLQPVRFDAIQRPQGAIQAAEDPQVVLHVLQSLLRDRRGVDALERRAVVGEHAGPPGLAALELLVPLVVLGGEAATHAQQLAQGGGGKAAKGCRQLLGLGRAAVRHRGLPGQRRQGPAEVQGLRW